MKILFITYDFTRTGAPKVLSHFLSWLNKYRNEIEFDILTIHPCGPLRDLIDDDHSIYDYSLYLDSSKNISLKKYILHRIKNRINRHKVKTKIGKGNYDLIYANTVGCLELGIQVKKQLGDNIPLLMHIHEASVVIKNMTPNFHKLEQFVSRFIVPSHLVEDSLTGSFSIENSRITIIPECSVIAKSQSAQSNLNKPFIIGGSGTVHWRKGTDLFIQVARYFKANYPSLPVQFRWVGKISQKELNIVNEDLRKADLVGYVKFTGEIEDPLDEYSSFNLFLMTSREDPFPLVCIELGMLGVPIICFENATGIQEIITSGVHLVPYLDSVSMAELVYQLFNSTDENQQNDAIDDFKKFLPENICPLYLKEIERVVNVTQ